MSPAVKRSAAGGTGSHARIPTLQKMAHLLSAFTPARPKWKLLELSRELGWDGATTHRFLKALVDTGMLECDEELNYRVGMLPLKLAAVSGSAEPGRQELLDRIGRIAEVTGLTTQLGVLDGDSVVILASQESTAAINAAASLGDRLPLHATAAGKAILSQLSDDEIRAILPERLAAHAEHTITDLEVLVRQVREVRESGLAHVDGELSLGLYAMAVPIPPRMFGSQVAALTCAGLTRALVPEKWDIAEKTLTAQAAALAASAARRGQASAFAVPEREATR
jgi:DNA-binding IclR family transcriptional regulator